MDVIKIKKLIVENNEIIEATKENDKTLPIRLLQIRYKKELIRS